MQQVPDVYSYGARWVTLHDTTLVGARTMPSLPHCFLRGPEPLYWFRMLEGADNVHRAPGFPMVVVDTTAERGAKMRFKRATYRMTRRVSVAVQCNQGPCLHMILSC